ncbi:hypothetical protein BU16DRAFT_579416 [Lophium mytilinum]|uniref:FAS1 domain-containing protein n=1 Tax=Lophium mytilinum TaxID=390894 RepID=A0A6A6R4A3_9PEZI|nr:hypothetical protein BU16DRAFT_579416 [Lophium mytilinum]
MKAQILFGYPAAAICLALTASADSRPLSSFLKSLHIRGNQSPLTNLPNIAMPPINDDKSSPEISAGIIISDVMGKTQDIAIFSGLSRDIDSVSDRLDDASQNATVLAPDNGAMRNLPRKPWEDPKEYSALGDDAYKGEAGEDRAHRNMRRFVEAHIVPESPWKEHHKVQTLNGNTIWYESTGGKKMIQPGNIEVLSIADKVAKPLASQQPISRPSTAMITVVDGQDLLICNTCGTQFDVSLQSGSPLKSCRICEDPRQYVPPGGQVWTTLGQLKGKHENFLEQDPTDEKILFITTEPKCGIGERAILLQTPNGNVLWDLIAFIDQKTIDFITSKGGLSAIVISHPHFYTTHLEWAKIFNCPVYVATEDKQWLNRFDHLKARRFIKGPIETIVPGVTAIKVGGHFDGSMVLHWEKKLFIADSMYTVPSAGTPSPRQPGTSSYSFMWSIPNMIPLPPSKIEGIWKALQPFEFEATYGGFTGQDVRGSDVKKRVLESMQIQVKSSGHPEHSLLLEKLEGVMVAVEW